MIAIVLMVLAVGSLLALARWIDRHDAEGYTGGYTPASEYRGIQGDKRGDTGGYAPSHPHTRLDDRACEDTPP